MIYKMITPLHRDFFKPIVVGMLLAVAGCGGDGGGGASLSRGKLTLQISDAPVDGAEHVYIQFSGLELQSSVDQRATLYYCQDPADAARTVVSVSACTTPPAPKRFDLLALNEGLADFLLEARDLGLYSSITDNGAGGLSSRGRFLNAGPSGPAGRGCGPGAGSAMTFSMGPA